MQQEKLNKKPTRFEILLRLMRKQGKCATKLSENQGMLIEPAQLPNILHHFQHNHNRILFFFEKCLLEGVYFNSQSCHSLEEHW